MKVIDQHTDNPKYASCQHRFGAMRGDILRINICGIFEVSASYQSLW